MATKKLKLEGGNGRDREFSRNDSIVSNENSPLTTGPNCNGKRVITGSRNCFDRYPPLLLCDRLKKVKPCKDISPVPKSVKDRKLNAEGAAKLQPASEITRSTSRKVEKLKPKQEQLAAVQNTFSQNPEICVCVKPSKAETYGSGVPAKSAGFRKEKEDHLSCATVSKGDDDLSDNHAHWPPEKAHRVAMLKARYADTILRAQMKLAADGAGPAPVVAAPSSKSEAKYKVAGTALRQETKSLVKLERPKPAPKISTPASKSKSEIQKEREAFRLSLEKMEKTVCIGDDMAALRELQVLRGYPPESLASPCPLIGFEQPIFDF